jgi:hypothetical protein
MARWVTRKGGKMIGSSSHACKQMGLMRDLQNLAVERRRQGNKMGIKKKRENGFRSSMLTFTREQEDGIDERFVKSRDRKER